MLRTTARYQEPRERTEFRIKYIFFFRDDKAQLLIFYFLFSRLLRFQKYFTKILIRKITKQ